ncbi:flagellar biosynthesis protein FlhG [Limimonas halophila]|uniref:Flagellar biosynthesis protein FlhG n=1 Tax=Limimonas halophila TaxID=1082479 RepID=A0A1G7M3S9_9PROT|nr:MinD/ParA family protein [Limimonas halophila]SDF56452.1 flagellar biosynthesis protein FlhG [Limimonas halophila]
MTETPAAQATKAAHSPAGNNVVAVASGKGGVGKTWFAITLAHAIARSGKRSLLFDGDLGLANVDVQLGLNPEKDLSRVLTGRQPITQAVQAVTAGGFDVIAGRSGSGTLASMAPGQLDTLGRSLTDIAPRYDRVILDLGAGVDRTVRSLTGRAGTLIVVITEEPTALTDAYAFIKLTKRRRPDVDVKIVVNLASSQKQGEQIFGALRKVCDSFLNVQPELLGVIRRDAWVRDSIKRQSLIFERQPNAAAASDVETIVNRLQDEA